MTKEQKRKIMLALAALWLKVLAYQVEQLLKGRRIVHDRKLWVESEHYRKRNGQFGKGEWKADKKSKGSSTKNIKRGIMPNMKKKKTAHREPQDVIKEYYDRATPGKGKLSHNESYDRNLHKNEIDTAYILHKTFGGDIRLLTESRKFLEKTPDCEWDGKLWEFKNLETEKAADGAIRRGLKQIDRNPGGLVLNYGNHKINYETLDKIISDRTRRGLSADTDIIIIHNGEVKQIKRHKK